MEARVLDAVRDSVGGGWVALYRFAEGRYRLRQALEVDDIPLPDNLSAAFSESLLTGPVSTWIDETPSFQEIFPEGTALIRMRAEFDHLPALLLLGRNDLVDGRCPDDVQRVIEVCAIALRNAELVERLQSEVFIDFLTNCYNRRAFEEHLTVEMVRARRYDRALCVLLLDLDDFKRINDTQGHPQGDYVLQRVAEALRTAFRTTDRVCRYGGDEFAVIFPETTRDDVMLLAKRVRRRIARLFPDDIIHSAITASIGVACYTGDARRADEFIGAADRALYLAKNQGRNRVVAS